MGDLRQWKGGRGFSVQGHVPKSGLTAREAVLEAKAQSRRGGGLSVCVHGPKMRPSEWHAGEQWFDATATLGCYINGRRSYLTLPPDLRDFVKHRGARRRAD